MAQSPNTTSGNPTVRRRSQRVLMQVGVRVRGKDSQSRDFDEETETLAINAHGALILVNARVTSGSKIIMQHKRTQEEQECHVVFLGPVRGGKAKVGLEFLEPRPTFWRVAFPPEDWSSKHPEVRPITGSRAEKR